MIKQVIIHDKNKDKINEILKQVQGKARERKIESYDELIALIDKYTKNINIPKKYWEGCNLYINIGAGHFASKYNGIPYGTHIELIGRKDGKFILWTIYRMAVKDKKPYYFKMTDIAKNSILSNMNIF
jgi:hypothetical protein